MHEEIPDNKNNMSCYEEVMQMKKVMLLRALFTYMYLIIFVPVLLVAKFPFTAWWNSLCKWLVWSWTKTFEREKKEIVSGNYLYLYVFLLCQKMCLFLRLVGNGWPSNVVDVSCSDVGFFDTSVVRKNNLCYNLNTSHLMKIQEFYFCFVVRFCYIFLTSWISIFA